MSDTMTPPTIIDTIMDIFKQYFFILDTQRYQGVVRCNHYIDRYRAKHGFLIPKVVIEEDIPAYFITSPAPKSLSRFKIHFELSHEAAAVDHDPVISDLQLYTEIPVLSSEKQERIREITSMFSEFIRTERNESMHRTDAPIYTFSSRLWERLVLLEELAEMARAELPLKTIEAAVTDHMLAFFYLIPAVNDGIETKGPLDLAEIDELINQRII